MVSVSRPFISYNSCNLFQFNYIYLTHFSPLSIIFFSDQECSLYWAVVSKYFDPNGQVYNAKVTLNYKCYSSWYFPNEITKDIVAMTSPPNVNTFLKEYTIQGFYGFSYPNTFLTAWIGNKAWIQFDFGQIVQIQKILVRARNMTGLFPNTLFDNIDARVGNVSSAGDFTGFTLLYHYPLSSGDGELVVFEGSAPLWGRYASLQAMVDNTFLCIANVNILGYT